MQEENLLENDDGLGHYPDGVKRTLTDEQIAMFRHSEIYAIVRQRQLRRENQDAMPEDEAADCVSEGRSVIEPEEQPTVSLDGALDSSKAILPLAPTTGEDLVNSEDGEEEYVMFLNAEKAEMRTDAALKKRKRNGTDTAGKRNRARTHRRLVRELDEVMVDDRPLDYGEVPAVSASFSKDSAQAGTSQTQCGRRPIIYDEEAACTSVEAPNVPHAGTMMSEQGRKIWWPTIRT